MDDFGYHTIWDITGADSYLLKDASALHDFFLGTLQYSRFTVLDHLIYKFDVGGEGVTGLYLLSESHLSYHTYPETHYISIDVYTCGSNNISINECIRNFFGSGVQIVTRTLLRGSNVVFKEAEK
ncbi:adenosylmethionine decarboxylase [Pseudomonas sp. SED1]|jgi:S-adenosylmethionine decarboxylase|uniref:adenosylmethionine decarboxylase n=1 Tax=Pseudomonas sp. SED1 TaxID=3056845 RepID=UPI00296FB881|nr:adenosylmethionine decarboxylase [Pseudomonas sp. SED1]MDY0833164.1 adenosylmethionine decarboxylase [Pseudomonas sp. SED1]